MEISGVSNSISISPQQKLSIINIEKTEKNNIPLAGHEKKLALSETSVAKLMDKREYQNLSEDLKKITPKILDPSQHDLTKNQLDLQIENSGVKHFMLMERIDTGIASSNLIALDIKMGTEATNLTELRTLGGSPVDINQKYTDQSKKSNERGAPENGFTLDGAFNKTNSPEYEGVKVDTRTKGKSNAEWAVKDIIEKYKFDI